MKLFQYYIFIYSIFILSSCNNDVEKEKLAKQEIKFDAIKITINTLEDEVQSYRKKLDSLQQTANLTNYLLKEDIKPQLHDSLNTLLDMPSLFERMKNNFLSNECGFDFIRLYNGYLFNSYRDIFELTPLEKIVYHFDRSSENIHQFFSEETISILVSVFPYEYYDKSGIKVTCEALIRVYEELDEEEFNHIYEVFNTPSRYINGEWVNTSEIHMKYINSIASDDVINILRKDKIYTNFDFNSDHYVQNIYGQGCRIDATSNRLLYIYSFWGRRQNEGNKKIVYEILKKINNKITLDSSTNSK
ncbi:hypothetical protein [Cellulophaga sp. L1A9]|uniref:hypothetical protein n=1 Tax=Cellulophaga sp. L1A9 TaxID=2686362 RepID=UPI00131C671B|nr:hypothetical protein [Cellulophaga sp. L1A9]